MFIDDQSGTISATGKAQIESLASPFDVKVIVSSTDSRAALDAKVSSMVNSANTLAIGVDPIHHYTFTHFGVGAGIPRDQYQTIAMSGNGEFKAGRWGDGIKAIVSNATAAHHEARSTNTTIVVPSQVTTIEHPVPILPFAIGGAALALGFILLWRWSKRRSAEVATTLDDFRGEAQQMRSRNIEEQGWHDKMGERVNTAAGKKTLDNYRAEAQQLRSRNSEVSSQPPQVIVAGSNNDSMLTGLLIGEALANRHEPPAREYTPAPAPRQESVWQASSSSSSSSWDTGSGGSDSGSGGGDFGGGFDSGGGGGDF